MISFTLLAAAIVAFLVWGLHLPLATALILTAIGLIFLATRGLFRRSPRKVVIVQDLETGRTDFQPMDLATRRYLATRPEKKHYNDGQ